jgi:hypothetical protein
MGLIVHVSPDPVNAACALLAEVAHCRLVPSRKDLQSLCLSTRTPSEKKWAHPPICWSPVGSVQSEMVIPVTRPRSSNSGNESNCKTYLDIVGTMCGLGQRRFLNKTLLDQQRVVQRGLDNEKGI